MPQSFIETSEGKRLALDQYLDASHRSGATVPVGGVQGQNITPASLLRSSSFQGVQGNGPGSGLGFPSLASPRTPYNADLSMLGNLNNGPNSAYSNNMNHVLNTGRVSPGLNGPGAHTPNSNSGFSGPHSMQRSLSVGAESMNFGSSSSMGVPASPMSFSSSGMNLPGGSSGMVVNSLNRHGSASGLEQQDLQQLQQQQQTAVSNPQFSQDSQQMLQHQQQLEQQQLQGQQLNLPHFRNPQVFGLGTQQMPNLASIKMEQQQMTQQQMQPMPPLGPVKMENQIDPSLRQQLQQPMQGLNPVKLEQMDASLRQQFQHQQNQALQNIGPMKVDSKQALHQQITIPKMEVKAESEMQNPMMQQSLLASHLQRQEVMQLQRQQSQQQIQAQLDLFQQQRILQQRRNQLHQQQQLQQLRRQLAMPPKQLVFEPVTCSRRLMQYMLNQRQRPQDNNIHFWRRFVAEFFAPGAKKRWCVSQYGNNGRQPTGVFPQDVWHCEICGSRPGRGFETTVEVLPRLYKIKYDSGILDELLFVDISNEYRLSSGHMVLEYGKAVQESIFEHLRVVREGQLRIIFTPELKIQLWEFCARGHEELLPRKLLLPQVTQLGAVVQKYQNLVNQSQNGASGVPASDLQSTCQLFAVTARHLARTLEAPTVNDLGYTKRYVRCLQISEVVNSMKDLIDFSRENGIGPIVSLREFPRRKVGGSSGDSIRQEHMTHQSHASEQNMGHTGSTVTSANNSSVTANSNSVSSFPHLPNQNKLSPLHATVPNNGPSPIVTDTNTSTSGLASNSITSSNVTNFSSMQNCHQSVNSGGELSSGNTFSVSAQQNSSSSSMNALQHPSGQPQHNLTHEGANIQQLQDFMIPSQVKNGVTQQSTSAAGNNINSLKPGVNMVSGSSSSVALNSNSFRGPNSVSEGFVGNDVAMGASISDSDSGNIGVSSSFGDSLANQNYLSGNGNNMGNMSMSNTESMMGNGSMHSSSAITEDQSLVMQDTSFLNDFGTNDILSLWQQPL